MDWASGARHLLREYAQQEPGTTRVRGTDRKVFL